MILITKPLLAPNKATTEADLDFTNGNYYLATPKIDGVRVLSINGQVVTRSFNPVKNDFVRETLSPMLPDNCDGEIVVGDPSDDNFLQTSGDVRRSTGEPDFKFCMFDYVRDDLNKPYEERVKDMAALYTALVDMGYKNRIECLMPVKVESFEEMLAYNTKCLEEGYQGIMLRDPKGVYKCGRGSVKQQIILKWKEFTDGEGEIVDLIEGELNNNVAGKDNFGRSKRPTNKENKVPSGMLGKFVVRDLATGMIANIGPGVSTHKLRKEIWENKEKYIGEIIKFKHFTNTGVKDSLRIATFQGFRDEDDM